MESPVEFIPVPIAEYRSLQEDALMLAALRDAGVDNWGQYHYAIETFEEWKSERLLS